MRYVTSGVLAVVIELLLLLGIVGMVNSSSKKPISYPQIISVNLSVAPSAPKSVSVKKGTEEKGKEGKSRISEEDMKLLTALKKLAGKTSKRKAGSPNGAKMAPLYKPSATPTVNASNSPFTSPNDVNPSIPKSYNPQFAQVNATVTSVYAFSQLINLGIPNFQEIEGSMRRDYEMALAKLPTEKAYTLGGTVKGIVEVQKDGSVRVQKIISSPSVTLTDIYVRNIEKLVTFPRSFALKDIEIDAIFNPSSKTVK